MSENHSFARSFMWMSFATAGLMVASQLGAFSTLGANASAALFEADREVPPSRLIVDLSDRQVSLYEGGNFQAKYDIAIGRAGWETPAGRFAIISKIPNPTWKHPFTGDVVTTGAENPLGSRWIGFWSDGEHQIGFHGTNQTDLIGQAVSHGCIRMRDGDIQAIYNQVTVGTTVLVQP
jgi:lipoprotein-anchoring transpeptidase ErfK/SrfK